MQDLFIQFGGIIGAFGLGGITLWVTIAKGWFSIQAKKTEKYKQVLEVSDTAISETKDIVDMWKDLYKKQHSDIEFLHEEIQRREEKERLLEDRITKLESDIRKMKNNEFEQEKKIFALEKKNVKLESKLKSYEQKSI